MDKMLQMVLDEMNYELGFNPKAEDAYKKFSDIYYEYQSMGTKSRRSVILRLARLLASYVDKQTESEQAWIDQNTRMHQNAPECTTTED